MNNFKHYVTPQEAVDMGDYRTLDVLQRLAGTEGTCINCDEAIWKFAGTGLCFSCTTGEADASEDYELKVGG